MNTTSTSVAIYVSGNTKTGFFIRYELQREFDSAVKAAIEARMRKSFLLDRQRPDAMTEAGINQKSQLMKNLFSTLYGLTATVIRV